MIDVCNFTRRPVPPIAETFTVQAMARHQESLLADIERRDRTIIARDATIDQMEAHRAEAMREVERLRRICRAAGIEYRTGVTP